MKTHNRQFVKQGGSALILVVVVTVLLAVIGVMFLMVSRASELETGAVVQNKNLDSAVDTVVARIDELLVQDLLGNNNIIIDGDTFDESYDASSIADTWLGDLEPTFGADLRWSHITDLWSVFPMSTLILDNGSGDPSLWMPRNPSIGSFYQADADGDGVADSRWVQVPGLTTSRGKPVFAAVRIIDNCAMLNLNAAHCFYQVPYTTDPTSLFVKPWFENGTVAAPYHDNQSGGSGRYLTEINYLPFLRGSDLGGSWGSGGDGWYNIMQTKGFWDTTNVIPLSPQNCQNIVMNIETPVSNYQFFDISDELELRNRYLVTSKVEARFEQDVVANYTLDSGNGAGGAYAALEVPRDITNDFGSWTRRIDSFNFDRWDKTGLVNDATPDPYEYDRRHVCTVYSYDRYFRRGDYTVLQPAFAGLTAGWTPQQIEQAERVFWSVGPVTTDIETPYVSYKYDDTSPSTLYPYAGPYNNVETRRKILHLLFAFREYFYQQNGNDLTEAAKSAAQVVANIIDYSDDDSPNSQIAGETEGPFYHTDYGEQANVDCTFITEQIIEDMMLEVSTAILGAGNAFSVPFALDSDPSIGIVFGYEKQPFISEVYVKWDGGSTPALQGFAIELTNPYDTPVDIEGWTLKVGTVIDHTFTASGSNVTTVPAYSNGLGRLVVQINSTGSVPGGIFGYDITSIDWAALQAELDTSSIDLLKPRTASSVELINIDSVANTDINKIIGYSAPSGGPGNNALKRDDADWKFVRAEYQIQRDLDGNYIDTLGLDNNINLPESGFQLGVADDGLPLCRWHELEVLGLYGNGPESSDPNAVQTVSSALADANSVLHFDLAGASSGLLDYVSTISRPDLGTLPGRININTAPAHVIAAAIPPSLADPNAADPAETVAFSALQLAQKIVEGRPYQKLSDLLSNVPEFTQYDNGGASESKNVGMQSIEDDIEEEHWILSNLANKFTVRSDVFTAYILVRLGEEGPQRRMIAIFDRSQVWDKNDRPKLVALHPVPDPR